MFLVTGCFQGHPQLHFTAGLAVSVGLQGTSRVNKSTFSLSSLAGAFSLSNLTYMSSSSGLTS